MKVAMFCELLLGLTRTVHMNALAIELNHKMLCEQKESTTRYLPTSTPSAVQAASSVVNKPDSPSAKKAIDLLSMTSGYSSNYNTASSGKDEGDNDDETLSSITQPSSSSHNHRLSLAEQRQQEANFWFNYLSRNSGQSNSSRSNDDSSAVHYPPYILNGVMTLEGTSRALEFLGMNAFYREATGQQQSQDSPAASIFSSRQELSSYDVPTTSAPTASTPAASIRDGDAVAECSQRGGIIPSRAERGSNSQAGSPRKCQECHRFIEMELSARAVASDSGVSISRSTPLLDQLRKPEPSSLLEQQRRPYIALLREPTHGLLSLRFGKERKQER